MQTLLLAAALSATLGTAGDGPSQLLDRFMRAWSASDANAIAGLFAPDADFVSPHGIKASGREAITAFYAAAFARGYRGSRGTGEVAAVRMIAPDLALVDGRWQIEGAKTDAGADRPPERGILVALLHRSGQGWEIVALREGNGAADFTAFPPAP
jgi:uncharacterized protein (TIGR02246 family)